MQKKNDYGNLNYNLDFFSKYITMDTTQKIQYINNYKQYFSININEIASSYINENILYAQSTRKFDLIYISHSFLPVNQKLMFELQIYYWFDIFVCQLYYALLRLQNSGNIVFNVCELTNKKTCDLVIFVGSFFEIYHIYKWECNNDYKTVNCSIIYKNYNSKSLDNFKKLVDYVLTNNNTSFPSTFKNMVFCPFLIDNNKIQFENIPDKYIDNTKEHIVGLINYKLDDPIYDKIRQHNEYVYFIKNNHLKMLISYMEMDNDAKEKFLIKYKEEQIMNALLYAKKWDFKTVQFDIKTFKTDFMKIIIQDMYLYYKPIIRRLKNYKIQNEQLINIPLSFVQANNTLESTDYIIDTRNILDWNKMKKIIRFYRPLNKNKHLKQIIDVNFNQQNISQTWIKMYEILKTYKLISRKATDFRSFHMCEAPGNFISAINHYIKTETNISNYDWMAQTLNPNLNNKGFKDDYGYIERYKERWNYGLDNTGDITNVENIKYYRRYTLDRNIKLLTSDCGLPESCGYSEITKVHIAQLLFILHNLSEGGNCVAKMKFPIMYPIQIYYYYQFCKHFKKVYFFKGNQNPSSKEFYLIGLKYHRISEPELEVLLLTFSSYDEMHFKDNKYPESFIMQLEAIHKELVDNYVFNFDRKLFYVDNYKVIQKQHFSIIEQMIDIKNIEWIKKYKIKKINNNDKL